MHGGDAARAVPWRELAQSPEFAQLEALRRRATVALLGGRETSSIESFDEVRVRAATGIGSETRGAARAASPAPRHRQVTEG